MSQKSPTAEFCHKHQKIIIPTGVLTQDDASQIVSDHTSYCDDHFRQIDSHRPEGTNLLGSGGWSDMRQPSSNLTEWDTGVDAQLLKYVGARSVDVKKGEKFVSIFGSFSIIRRG